MCAGLDGAEIRDLLQRRSQLKRNLAAGRTESASQREVLSGPDLVQHLLFSPDSKRLAVVTTQQVSMFALPGGRQLWQKDLTSISEQNEMEVGAPHLLEVGDGQQDFMGWLHTADLLYGCCHVRDRTVVNFSYPVSCLHIFSLEAQAGSLVSCARVQLAQLDGITAPSCCLDCKPAFSHAGGDIQLAVLLRLITDTEDRRHEVRHMCLDKLSLLVLDAQTCAVKLLTGFRPRNTNPYIFVHDRQALQPIWSLSDSMIAWQKQLVIVGTGHVFDLPSSSMSDGGSDPMSFDRTQGWLGLTARAHDRHSNWSQIQAHFVDTASGRVLHSIDNRIFHAFCTTRLWALMSIPAEARTAELWDVTRKACMCKVFHDCAAPPQLLLDDAFVHGAVRNGESVNAIQTFIAVNGAASSLIRAEGRTMRWEHCNDECTAAAVIEMSISPADYRVVLVNLQ